jgi:hypothetical protein
MPSNYKYAFQSIQLHMNHYDYMNGIIDYELYKNNILVILGNYENK